MRKALLLLLVLAAAPLRADLPPGKWAVSQQIVLPKLAGPSLVYLPLSDQVLAIRSLSELRVVRDGHLEEPYRLVVERGQVDQTQVPARMSSLGVSGTERAQVVLALAPEAPEANQVRLALAGDNFRCKVVVEKSADQAQWWQVGTGLVYRHEQRFEEAAVRLPIAQYRYLRLTLVRLQGKLPQVEGASVWGQVLVPARTEPVPAAFTVVNRRRDNTTELTWRLARPARELVRADLAVAEPTFDRPVAIMVGRPLARTSELVMADTDALRRLRPGDKVQLPLAIGEVKLVQVVVSNGDDRPLTIRSGSLLRLRQGVIFRAQPGGRYELWYDRRQVPQPVYDIQRLPLLTPPSRLPQASLGAVRRMALAPPPPPPWSEQHPVLFWAALVGVLVLLGAVVLRAMRRVGEAQEGKAG